MKMPSLIRNFQAYREERKNTETLLSTSQLAKELLQRASSKSGVAVNWRTALQASTFFACSRVIAEGLAQVPFKLFKERQEGGKDPGKDHALYEVLSLKPNAWQTSFEFREQMGLHLAVMGDFYAFKVRGLRGEILELLPFEPNLVTQKRLGGMERSYLVTTQEGRIEVPSSEMWHVRGISWNGMEGLPGVRLAREAIGLSLALEGHAARMFRNGAKPGGLLTTKSKLDKQQIELLRESWESTQGGGENAWKTAILSGDLSYSDLAQTSVDSQHHENRRMQVEETCRFMRVMPIMVMQADKAATYASSENMFIAHVVHTLMPWYTRVEMSANVNLLTASDRADGYYTRFMAQALMRGAMKDRAEYYSKALGSGGAPGWMTQDQIRDLEEMNPMGGAAAELPIPTNVGGGSNNQGDSNAPA